MPLRNRHHNRSIRRPTVRRRLLMERLGDRRVFAAITGEVFADANQSFHKDADEGGLENRFVYVDSNVNGRFDTAEPYALTDGSGKFTITDLADGSYVVRVYSGSATQTPTFPSTAAATASAIPLGQVDPLSVVEFGQDSLGTVILEPDALTLVNAASGASQRLEIGTANSALEALPDGSLVVVGADDGAASAWIVDVDTFAAQSVDLASGQGATDWSDLVLGADAKGVLLEHSDVETAIRAVDFSDPTSGPQVTETTTLVPAGTSAITSAAATRTVLASPSIDGLNLSLWSNSAAELISANPILVTGAAELVAYDDASGLLVLRNDSGGVKVVDTDGNFAALFDFPDATGPVHLDGPTQVLVVAMASTSTVDRYDLSTGGLISRTPVDLTGVGLPMTVVLDPTSGSLSLGGALGLRHYNYAPTTSASVQVVDGNVNSDLKFGFYVVGENTLPVFDPAPNYTLNEDTSLIDSVPGVLRTVVDPNIGDAVLVVQTGEPSSGTGTIHPQGRLAYTPNADYVGNDTIPVMLHDGRGFSNATVSFNVVEVPDSPTGIEIDVDPVPEFATVGLSLGSVEIVDVDLNGVHEIFVSDGRFEVINGQLVYVGGGLDFETQSSIPLEITAYDTETSGSVTIEFLLSVTDQNDPVEEVFASTQVVSENAPGATVGTVWVRDQDFDDEVTYTVDDPRFEVVDDVLKLRDGESLDYEAEQTVNLRLTGADDETSASTDVVIEVGDVSEAAATISLDNQSVLELEPGAVVGGVGVNDYAGVAGYELTINDDRFEIVDGQLKLVDNVWLEKSVAEEVEVVISARDTQAVFDQVDETFVITVLENDTPYHNDDSPFDVDGDGYVRPIDALMIINYINEYGVGPVGHGDPGYGYDVNGDGFVTPLDALLVINEIDRLNTQGGATSGEGEVAGTPDDGDQEPAIAQDDANDAVIEEFSGSLKVANVSSAPADQLSSSLQTTQVTNDESDRDSIDKALRLLGDDWA